jgi:hypothetical protein
MYKYNPYVFLLVWKYTSRIWRQWEDSFYPQGDNTVLGVIDNPKHNYICYTYIFVQYSTLASMPTSLFSQKISIHFLSSKEIMLFFQPKL